MSDDEKHVWCRQRTGYSAVILWPWLYDQAEQAGYDMRWYVKAKPMPAISSSAPTEQA